MAISMAPGLSKVIVYEAPNPSPCVDILNRMANDNLAKQLSCSWYVPGGAAEPAADQIFQQMAAQGQSFFNASGDYDAYTGPIDFPGDSTNITQVGGTTLTTSGPGGAGCRKQCGTGAMGSAAAAGSARNIRFRAGRRTSTWRPTKVDDHAEHAGCGVDGGQCLCAGRWR